MPSRETVSASVVTVPVVGPNLATQLLIESMLVPSTPPPTATRRQMSVGLIDTAVTASMARLRLRLRLH